MRFDKDKVTVKDTKNFWENNPFYVYEAAGDEENIEFFKKLEEIKETDTETFSKHLWGFDQFNGKRVLDIGCGPGWYSVNLAKNGAKVVSLDLTENAIFRCRRYFKAYGLHGDKVVADAQQLPFKSNSFDGVISSGVLHHAPNVRKTIEEVHRILKPGGRSTISIYYKNALLRWPTFYVTRFVVNSLLDVEARQGIREALTPEEFVRLYDGDDNPLGHVFTREECRDLFSMFKTVNIEVHMFMLRFFPFVRYVPRFVHSLLDRWFGIMFYVQVRK